MKNLNLTVKQIVTVGTLLVVIGSAWATSQSDIRSVAHSAKENSEEMSNIEKRLNSRMIRMEARFVRLLNRNFRETKRIKIEAQ